MGKKAREKGVADQSKHGILHKKTKLTSHTGAKPLVESFTNKGVMVTQKIRDAQQRRRQSN